VRAAHNNDIYPPGLTAVKPLRLNKPLFSSTRLKNLQKAETNKAAERTRKRLLAASGAIFAKVGYQAATTRQICMKARANAAAVNYHFGDKLGLYTAVLKTYIQLEEERVAQHALLAGAPGDALTEFISMMFENLAGEGTQDTYTRLMAHELSQPTPRLGLVVERIIRPRALLLCEIVSRLTGHAADSRQTRMSAHSVIGQVVHYIHARPVIKLLWPEWQLNAASRRAIAAHISAFSLAALKRK
jgi:TetR/AcrR family transcriptional regulator, regulator of cefoperazone and chloramphenicol sensitivity